MARIALLSIAWNVDGAIITWDISLEACVEIMKTKTVYTIYGMELENFCLLPFVCAVEKNYQAWM